MADLKLMASELDQISRAIDYGSSSDPLGKPVQVAADVLYNIIIIRVKKEQELDLRTARDMIVLKQWPKLADAIKNYVMAKKDKAEKIYGYYVTAYQEWEKVCKELGISPL